MSESRGSAKITDEKAFTSKPFSFIVEGTSFFVHAGLVSQCSGPLDRMINGHLSEAHQGFAILDDVDKETFVRFVRWTYSRDYMPVEHSIVKGEVLERQTTESVQNVDDDWDFWASSKKSKKGKKKSTGSEKLNLKESFIQRQYDQDENWGSISSPAARSNKKAEEDYTEVFLCHARIYVFAEKYDIQPLKQLALMKLQQTLAIFTLFEERVRDVTTLLKYVYANTSEASPDQEDIRSMLAHYIGCEMATLVKDGEIKDLLSENEEMLNDFLQMFAQRLS